MLVKLIIGNLLQNSEGSNVYMFKGKENFIADILDNPNSLETENRENTPLQTDETQN